MRGRTTRDGEAEQPSAAVKNDITPDGLTRLEDERRFLLLRERCPRTFRTPRRRTLWHFPAA